MCEKKDAVADKTSAATEDQQPQTVNYINTIPRTNENIKKIIEENNRIAEEEMAELERKGQDPSFLNTCSAQELLDKYSDLKNQSR